LKTIHLRIHPMFYVSVYLRLLPEDRADRPPRYLLRFKNLVRGFKEFIKEKGLDERDYEGVFSDFDRIEDFISYPKNLEGGRGIAIFSNGQEGSGKPTNCPLYIEMPLSWILSHTRGRCTP